jgi:hypothetical protein
MRMAKYPGIPQHTNPFVLKGVAVGTRYSPAEYGRIMMLTEKHDFRLFKNLGIDEREGDRLLVLCRPRRA